MNKYQTLSSIHACAAGLLLTLALAALPSMAHDYVIAELEVLHPYAPPTPPGVAMAAGYLEIVNHGDSDERLLGGKAYFAHEVQIHQTVVEDDVSRMRELEDGLVIPAGATIKIEPLGIHLMFAGLAEPLVEGDYQKATLFFEKAGELEVEFIIEHPGSNTTGDMHESGMPMDHSDMDHSDMKHSGMKGMKH